MSIWLWAEIALLLSTLPCAVILLRSREAGDWAIALQMSGLVVVLALLVLAQAMKRPLVFRPGGGVGFALVSGGPDVRALY